MKRLPIWLFLAPILQFPSEFGTNCMEMYKKMGKKVWKRMCKFFCSCVKFLKKNCSFQIYTAISDHVNRPLLDFFYHYLKLL